MVLIFVIMLFAKFLSKILYPRVCIYLCSLTAIDLLLKLGDRNLRLLRIYGNSIERKDHIGPYYNKQVGLHIVGVVYGSFVVGVC